MSRLPSRHWRRYTLYVELPVPLPDHPVRAVATVLYALQRAATDCLMTELANEAALQRRRESGEVKP